MAHFEKLLFCSGGNLKLTLKHKETFKIEQNVNKTLNPEDAFQAILLRNLQHYYETI